MSSAVPHVVVVINPVSATGKRGAIGSRVADAFKARGFAVTALLEQDAASLATALARVLSTRPDAVIAVGGDGLVHLVVEQLVGTEIPLGLIPTGTGNDFARGLGVSLHVDEALRATLRRLSTEALARGRTVDTGLILGQGVSQPFVGALSAGFDAAVNKLTNRMVWPRGRARYILAVLIELVRLRSRKYRMLVDGDELETSGILVSIANNSSFGGGIKIVPDARLDDGFLDLFIVSKISRIQFLLFFPRVFRGTHTSIPEVTIRRVTEVTVECEGVTGFADGEEVGALPLTVRVVPKSLRVLA
ncbi:diacylglycerol kinase family protein [Lysinibacter sp. HNR]|uniref:diacylglycerol/lipid kinase family protein n=1 Tax=Lysinibacter sp. HNR TaxID=3031408 RepID=UPI00243523E9|nr:diacylglycerol kinase family protein [Lysinibacter sp. HNR]WGD37890.1 diacylglycerol kinase family protein [Lysinibacter sp. HNR]